MLDQIVALLNAGQADSARAQCDRVLQANPNNADGWYLHGIACLMGNSHTAAIDSFRRALALQPGHFDAWLNLGATLAMSDRNAEAIPALESAARLRPEAAIVHFNLGVARESINQPEAAVVCYRRALSHQPDYVEALINLGQAYAQIDEHENAMRALEQALRLRPHDTEIHYNLGTILLNLDQPSGAIDHLRQTLQLNPEHARARYNLGLALVARGQLPAALDAYRSALSLVPDYRDAQDNLLLLTNYLDSLSPDAIFHEHINWGKRYTRPPRAFSPRHPCDRTRRIRIGYVSADYRNHSVSYFLEGILCFRDRARFEIYCYSDTEKPDAMTDRLRGLVDQWVDIRGQADTAVVGQILSDKIDILIDLAGHTGNNRLPVFAEKPAPIQVTYLGYPNTTGLTAIDYRLTDLDADPVGQERFHTEKLIRLPHGFLCYTPPAATPDVTCAPVTKNGYVTFGSFNNLAKMTPAVIALWAQLLNQLPHSRIVLKNKSLGDLTTRETYFHLFAEHGIAPGRIELLDVLADTAEHLATYHRIDIALDTFPYNGTTTTCEALWMGVPVVTLAGDRHAARVGLSILSRVGLPVLIAKDQGDYVRIAIDLAHDPARLSGLRHDLRERMKNSPLCDAKTFARDLEAAYREMWQKYCETQAAS